MTLNLHNLTNGNAKEEPAHLKTNEPEVESNLPDKEISLEELTRVWGEFAEQRKSQVGEYHLLKEKFDFQDNLITIHLSNTVEEPLLQDVKPALIAYIRSKLKNNSLNVVGKLRAVESQKIAYTDKEKFDKLAIKNPILIELKERLGLDSDY